MVGAVRMMAGVMMMSGHGNDWRRFGGRTGLNRQGTACRGHPAGRNQHAQEKCTCKDDKAQAMVLAPHATRPSQPHLPFPPEHASLAPSRLANFDAAKTQKIPGP